MEKSVLKYQPLGPGQIRLLTLTSTTDLAFTLEAQGLDDGVKYYALSYTWGGTHLTHQICVDGCMVLITENLHLALTHLQRGVEGKRVKYPLKTYFWIDSLCINQADDAEKSVQVQSMAKIFSTAEKVYVWLGTPADITHNRVAWHRLREMNKRILSQKAQALSPWWNYFKPFDASAVEVKIIRGMAEDEIKGWSDLSSQTQEAWNAIRHIFASPYWTRAWAYQEGTVREPASTIYIKYITTPKAPKSVVKFVSGNLSFTWQDLGTAFALADFLINSQLPGTELLRGSAKAFARVQTIRTYRNQTEEISALDVLDRFRVASCTDTRDHVYACIGFLPSHIQQLLVPDYSLDVAQVYREVAERLSALPHINFNLLGYALMPAPDWFERNPGDVQWKGLPSWVPNWSVSLDFSPLPKVIFLQGEWTARRLMTWTDRRAIIEAHTVKEIPAYNACGRFNQIKMSIEGPLLKTPGFNVDTIVEVQTWRKPMSLLTPVMREWRNILRQSTYEDVEDFDRDLRRVQCADVQYQALPRRKAIRRGYEINNTLLFKPENELTSEELVAKRSMQLTQAVITKGRALGGTKHGRLALVPYSSQPGDHICIFFGAQVPYVLRPNKGVDGTHTFVGETYVSELMDGEISKLADEEQLPVELFILA